MGIPRWAVYTWIALLLAAAVAGTWTAAITSSNTVPASNLLSQANNPTLINLADPACAGIAGGLTNLVKGTGNLTGTAANDLIMNATLARTLSGGNGDDCLMGGSGNDTLNGQVGANDICIGGPGTDTFNASCEVQIQ